MEKKKTANIGHVNVHIVRVNSANISMADIQMVKQAFLLKE